MHIRSVNGIPSNCIDLLSFLSLIFGKSSPITRFLGTRAHALRKSFVHTCVILFTWHPMGTLAANSYTHYLLSRLARTVCSWFACNAAQQLNASGRRKIATSRDSRADSTVGPRTITPNEFGMKIPAGYA